MRKITHNSWFIRRFQGEAKNGLDNIEVGCFLVEGLAQHPAGQRRPCSPAM